LYIGYQFVFDLLRAMKIFNL